MSTKLKGAVASGEIAHAKYSASGSKRWLSCSGSIALEEKAPKGQDSIYAKEGRTAHSVLEFLVKNRKKRLAAADYLRKKYPLQMVIHAEAALNYLEKRLEEYPGAELLSEIRCDLPVSFPGQFGTTDLAIVDHFGRLIVIDYKYGAGVPVFPAENSQLIYYALGLAHKYDYNFADVEVVVVQPRRAVPVDGKERGCPEETIRSWVTTTEKLIEWRGKFDKGIERAILASKNPEEFLFAGDHCQFCPAAVICPEIKNKSLRKAQAAFDDDSGELSLPAPNTPTLKLEKVLPALDNLEKWIAAVRKHAEGVLHSGGEIKGWGLIDKRAQRKWVDPRRAAVIAYKKFGHTVFSQRELMSPAQLESVKIREATPAQMKAFADKYSVPVSSGVTLGPIEKEVSNEEVKPKRKKLSKT